MSCQLADLIEAHSELAWDGSDGKTYCQCGVALCLTSESIFKQYRKLYVHAANEIQDSLNKETA